MPESRRAQKPLDAVMIHERPVYVGGTGPAMAPVTPMPADDERSWIIAEIIVYDKVPQYVIHPRGKPAVRQFIKKEKVLDRVSPRVLEEFEYKEFSRQQDEEEKISRMRIGPKKRRGKGRSSTTQRSVPQLMALAQSIPSPKNEISEDESLDLEVENALARQPSLSQPYPPQLSLSQPSISQNLLKRTIQSLESHDIETTGDEGVDSVVDDHSIKRQKNNGTCKVPSLNKNANSLNKNKQISSRPSSTTIPQECCNVLFDHKLC